MTADKLKLVLAVLIAIGGIVGFYYFGDKPSFIRLAVMLTAATVAIVFAAQTDFGRNTWEFAKGARMELRKVVWPTNKETMQVTLIVFVMVVLVAIYMWIIDWGLHKIVRVITG